MIKDSQELRLTEYNLALHNEALQKDSRMATVAWVEKVIMEEQIHQFHSQLKMNDTEQLSGMDIEGDIERINQSMSAMEYDSTQAQTIASLKLFEQTLGLCLESPLERFLTPDGCSDPSYFARLALTQMDTPLGSMDKRDERREMAKKNVELVVSRKD
ncbi:hypothetical protein ASPWEDRAFT_173387 [Aspergillus wentii DTO 134E9]|uniref:Uncharacterized protein n=1 Tax=Aspergillus wentii DTO 134E9 TaxID=1073089 RepID=A0A1L9RG95_ASPWE|nr:uncharacterized protein ASPWEDRAFT_173387 [Aspergillus wentii DTO 134E9]OJJ33952.1 hypothetical protein ASPWEDRAFT_173387 [Aspergillus wentii DTO 134E9]